MFLISTLGVLAVIMALIMTPIVRDGVGKFFLDHPDGGRKKHATPIPRVGGIAIVLAYVATFAIAFSLNFSYTVVLHKALPNILQLTLVGLVVFPPVWSTTWWGCARGRSWWASAAPL